MSNDGELVYMSNECPLCRGKITFGTISRDCEGTIHTTVTCTKCKYEFEAEASADWKYTRYDGSLLECNDIRCILNNSNGYCTKPHISIEAIQNKTCKILK